MTNVHSETPQTDVTDLLPEESTLLSPACSEGLPRWIEVPLALSGLAVALPVLALCAAAVAATSPGAVIFRQQRMGRHGNLFTLYKIRTMTTDASKRGPGVTSGDDVRMTRVGRLLRKTKLDEFPELWNIVRGDMAFVGPRPEVPVYVDLKDPLWQAVLTARPGLTDPMTLRLRNEEALLTSVPGDRELYYRQVLVPYKLRGYKEYLARRSWRTDIAVLLRTVQAVVLPVKAPPPTVEEIAASRERDRF